MYMPVRIAKYRVSVLSQAGILKVLYPILFLLLFKKRTTKFLLHNLRQVSNLEERVFILLFDHINKVKAILVIIINSYNYSIFAYFNQTLTINPAATQKVLIRIISEMEMNVKRLMDSMLMYTVTRYL